MEEVLIGLLTGATTVTDLTAEVNWGVHPQGVPFPGVVLNVVGGTSGVTLDGPNGTGSALVQVDAYAATYGEAKLLSRAIEAVLNGHRGGAIMGVFLVSRRDGREGDVTADRPFRVSTDFRIHYRR
ncbi:DUF3168 domain-containing protein [Jannaschia sp. M317]|nr:DUF3168 domain-containing protein [Jannaschia sp. M317]